MPPRTEPVPVTGNGSASPSTSDAEAAQRVQQRCDGPGPGLLVAVELDHRPASAATGGTNRSTVPASPQSTRAPAPGDERAGDGQVGRAIAVDASRPSVRSAPIIRSVSRLRSAPLMVDVPWPCAAASAARTSVRLVCDFEPGTVNGRVYGRGA